MVLIIIGVLCILYYISCVLYAGFGASAIWIWLLGGVMLMILGMGRLYCKKNQIPVDIPFAAKCMIRTGVVCLIGFFLLMECLIFSGMLQRGEKNLDYVIVLGCQVKGTRPSRALQERLDTAREYLEENPETAAILSGGKGTGEEISEAECMYRYLQEKGIAEERLLMEDASTTTVENLIYSSQYLNTGEDSVGIISNNFHIYRSLQMAKKAGYQNVCGIAAPSRTLLQPHYLVREVFALVKAILQGTI